MTNIEVRQLNPFELKAAISNLISKIDSTEDMPKFLNEFEELDAQNNKALISDRVRLLQPLTRFLFSPFYKNVLLFDIHLCIMCLKGC